MVNQRDIGSRRASAPLAVQSNSGARPAKAPVVNLKCQTQPGSHAYIVSCTAGLAIQSQITAVNRQAIACRHGGLPQFRFHAKLPSSMFVRTPNDTAREPERGQ